MEGSSIQELSAIQMNALTRQIVDVFHEHARTEDRDSWARFHVHGLSPDYLKEFGHPNEDQLILSFRKWLRGKEVMAMFANDPAKEEKALNMCINDMTMPPWRDRVYLPYHQIALTFKNNFTPILDKRCCKDAHCSYSGYPVKSHSRTELAKREFGFHCSLYDAYELYLCYIFD